MHRGSIFPFVTAVTAIGLPFSSAARHWRAASGCRATGIISRMMHRRFAISLT